MDNYRNNSRRAGRDSVDGRQRVVDDSRNARSRYAYDDSTSSNAYSRGRSSRENSRENHRESVRASYRSESAGAADAYSRRLERMEYSDQLRKRKRRKIVLIALAALLLLVLAGVAYGVMYIANISKNMHEGVDENLEGELVDPVKPDDPFYMLLIGADRSDEREVSSDTFRSDSMILCRVDPTKKQVTMVSLHRDTIVDMGEYGERKLNSSHAIGGPAFTVQIVSEMAGVDIAHYVEIDFDGFREAVDALGGVEVNVPMEIYDEDAGGYVPAGLQTLNGEQALILCRARNAFNDYGDGDRYRAAHQRLVLSAVAKKILSSDVTTMISTVEALSKYIITDFEPTEIISLARQMNGMDTVNDIYTSMEPTTSFFDGDGWYEYLDKEAWKVMMERVDAGLPPTTTDEIDADTGVIMSSVGDTDGYSVMETGDSKLGTVQVKNGAGIAGVATKAKGMIAPMGFVVNTGNAQSNDYDTSVVVYADAGRASAAREIAKTLGIEEVIHDTEDLYFYEGDILVLIGRDWA